MDESGIWRLEERLWLEGAAAYADLVAPDCLMVFVPVGVLRGEAVPASLGGAPRWQAVTMGERAIARPAEGLAVLAYRADATREGGARYRAWCSSTWVTDGGAWRMVQHQQSAAG